MNLDIKSAAYKTAMEMYGKQLFDDYMKILSDPATFLLETVCYKQHQKTPQHTQHAKKKAKKDPTSASRNVCHYYIFSLLLLLSAIVCQKRYC